MKRDIRQPTQEPRFDLNPVVMEVPNEAPTVEIPVLDPPSTTAERLDKAASDILQALPDHIVTAFTMAADSLHISVWQELAGIMVAAFNSGMLYAPVLDPAWSSDIPIREKESTCPQCGQVYTPKYRRQVYCSNACGSKAMIQRVSV